MEHWLSQLGAGTKHLADRYAEYPAPAHDQQLYYAYEPSSPSHGHVASSKHQYSGGGHKGNAAMSALTLLAFLFFLHILQQCLKEHVTAMSTPQVMVVSAGRDGDQSIPKTSRKDKLDKTGVFDDLPPARELDSRRDIKLKNKMGDENDPPHTSTDRDIFLTRIATAEHTPRGINGHKNKIVNSFNKSSIFEGFVSAMVEK